jgi:Transposase, Mutator family
VREEGVIRSRAVLVALGVDWEGRRQVLAVERLKLAFDAIEPFSILRKKSID